MNIWLFSLCCFLAITAIIIGVLGLSVNQKCSECVNNPSIWCYSDWQCNSGPQPKQLLDDILGTNQTPGICTRDPVTGTSCECPNTSSWPSASTTPPNGNYGAGGGTYNPALSNGVNVCNTFKK